MDDQSNHNGNGHEHAHTKPIESITITFDPNHGSLRYELQNMDYATAIQRLELAQLFLFENLKQAAQKELTP